MNIFLCKITDEIENPKDLQFSWAGYSADTPFNLVDRLQKLYQIGMKEYLNQDITYYSKEDIDKAFNENYKKRQVGKRFIISLMNLNIFKMVILTS